MKETVDKVKDLKLVAKHDKRYLAAVCFIIVCVAILMASSKWEQKRSKKSRLSDETEVVDIVSSNSGVKISNVVPEIVSTMKERKKTDDELLDEIKRMNNKLEQDKKDINNSLAELSKRMDDASRRLDSLSSEYRK